MAQRGRKSIENMMLLEGGLAATTLRPDAPYDLTDEQAVVWKQIIEAMPADHFIPANYPVLSQLCRHIIDARRVAQLIQVFCKKKGNFEIRTYLELLKQQAAESLSIARLSRSMRLTQQSTHDQHMRLPKNRGGPKPWDREEDE